MPIPSGHVVEADLHIIEQGFMLPAVDPTELAWRSFLLERADKISGQVTIMIDVTFTI
jgi:hypothetical protein